MPVIPFLFWLTLWGNEPIPNQPNRAAALDGAVLGQPLLTDAFRASVGTGVPVTSPAPATGIGAPPVTSLFRAQSPDVQFPGAEFPSADASGVDVPGVDVPEFVVGSPLPRGIHRTLAYELWDTFNPFFKTTVRVLPNYYDPYGWQASYGTNGYQPWRLGWSIFHEVAVLPTSSVSGGTTGEMQIVEWNSNVRLSELIAPGILFNGTGYFNAQYWDGPGGIDLGGQVDQLSLDLELGFFNDGPWSGQIAFHPQIVDGFDQPLNGNAFNFDGRAIATYMVSPAWSLVGGFAVWDRVDLMLVPHVGAIWTPDARWELRLLYPRTRISYYLGRMGAKEMWLYGIAEYTAASWQANIGDPTLVADRIQLTDDRLSLGIRWDGGRHSVFIEGGYVFNRHVKFAGPTPHFDISNAGMIRAGIRF